MADVICLAKHLPRHISRRWPDARQPWWSEALDQWDAGLLPAHKLRRLMAENQAFARYATVRLGQRAGARLCGND